MLIADKNVGVAWAATGRANTDANVKMSTATLNLVKAQPLPLETPARPCAS